MTAYFTACICPIALHALQCFSCHFQWFAKCFMTTSAQLSSCAQNQDYAGAHRHVIQQRHVKNICNCCMQ